MRKYADEFDMPVVSAFKTRNSKPSFDYTEVVRKEHEAVKALVAKASREHMEAEIKRRLAMSFPDRRPLEQPVITVHPVALQAKSVHEALTLIQVVQNLEAMMGGPTTIQVGYENSIDEAFRLPQFSYFGC